MDPPVSAAPSPSQAAARNFVGAYRVDREVNVGFGHYAPPRCWQRGIAGGYHEPAPRANDSLGFKDWMAKWTSPDQAAPTWKAQQRRVGDPSGPLHAAPSQALSRSSSRPPTGREGGEVNSDAPPASAARTLRYPNHTNWKRSTSLTTRAPGFVGQLRTR